MQKDKSLPKGIQLGPKGKYEIIELLGQGGFSFVYKAQDTEQGRLVALKEFFWHGSQQRASDGLSVCTMRGKKKEAAKLQFKFKGEYRKISSFDNYNIIEAYDQFDQHGTSYYAMEYIEEAVSLEEYCCAHEGNRLAEDEAIYIVEQVADALRAMHAKKYNHADVKPGNILIDKEKMRAILIDFGTAHQYEYTLDDAMPSLRAPGQETTVLPVVSGPYTHPLTHDASCFFPSRDIYSLGVTLCRIVTGSYSLAQQGQEVSEPLRKLIELSMRPVVDGMDVMTFIQSLSRCKRSTKPQHRVTRSVTSLRDDEIFVFGSNVWGKHSGGAAGMALKRWGAIWGLASGPQGRTYAIPTVSGRANNVKLIEPYVKQFEQYAREHSDKLFLVTKIGCGSAGFTEKQIAPFFKGCMPLPNVHLPESFWEVLGVLV